jgi:hypothetical protein
MPVGDNDLDAFLADFGVDVSFGAATAKGILDEEQDIADLSGLSNSGVIKTTVTLTYRTSALALKHGAAITADGKAYRVKDTREIDDGKFSKAILAKG